MPTTSRNLAPMVRELTQRGRVSRRPQHPFQVRTRPWQIAPFFIAPVLPGETLNNLLHQSRVITDPINNRLIGWWQEYYYFYVKHRDLSERDEFVSMVLDPSWTIANVDSTADLVEHYFAPGTSNKINWVVKCLQRVTEEYFRFEDEAWDFVTVGNLPAAQVTGRNWMDSLAAESTYDDVLDVDADQNADDTYTVGEISSAMAQYEFLRQNMATDMTYEEFLRSYGVRQPRTELHVPELVRFVRDWQYPVSAIDPTDGSAASAVTWSITERADKARFFSEPGFLFGVSVTRPKVYFSRQTTTATTLLDNAYAWLPAVLTNDPRTSLRLIEDVTGPVGDIDDAGGAWVDLRDLFLYGEQFVNFALSETDAGFVALPTAGLQKRYADGTMADAMFAAASPANQIRQDGIVTLNISGRQVDTSPSS